MIILHRRTQPALHFLLLFGLLIASLGLAPVSPAPPRREPPAFPDSTWSPWTRAGSWQTTSCTGPPTAGITWNAITPPLPGGAAIAAVDFSDSLEGRALLVDASGADPLYSLGVTHDGGATWETGTLDLFAPGDVSAIPDKVYMQWLGPQTGWLVIKRATGINFSVGSLFRTDDGGLTWTQLSIPVGEPVTFVDENIGWVAGGAAGDELYRTTDGGGDVGLAGLRAVRGEPRRETCLPVPQVPGCEGRSAARHGQRREYCPHGLLYDRGRGRGVDAGEQHPAGCERGPERPLRADDVRRQSLHPAGAGQRPDRHRTGGAAVHHAL